MSPRHVPDDGSPRSRLVLIGEAPGRYEDAQGRPFVGPAGQRLSLWWRSVGLQRSDFYITNVYPYRPPNDKIKMISHEELAPWIDDLHNRLALLDDPYVIVPTGDTALRALVGRGGITKHRGSIYAYQDRRGRVVKVIPTIHPAATFRQPGWERRCLADWRRIAGDTSSRELRTPVREHYIRPTWDDLCAYVEDARQRAEVLAFDIETPRELVFEQRPNKRGKIRTVKRYGDPRIVCVGFAFDPYYSITIPTTEKYWGGEDALIQVWTAIQELLALPCEKAAQNHIFDTWWLAQYGVRVENLRWDTRWMSHAADPLDDHDLAYQASIHTREPYWKDDTKEKTEDHEIPDLDAFWTYNGKDCCVTRELADTHHQRLATAGRLAFYDRQYVEMYPLLLDLSLTGTRVNARAQRARFARLTAECIAYQDRLTEIAGEPLYGKKDLSNKKLQRYLYEVLCLPIQKDRKTGGVTTKEVVVRRLMLKYPAKLGTTADMDKAPAEIAHAGPLILLHRRKAKLASFVTEKIADPDGRVRSQFGFVDTLRLSSGKNPRRTGQNSQNVDRELLDLYVPDEGHVFLEVDLSQAEDRVVKMLTKSPRLIERARSMPWENDEHKRAASIIFHVSLDKVTKDQRYLGKRVRHAGNYGMRGTKLSEELLKEGVVIAPAEGDLMIDTVLDKDTPEVRDWQREVRKIVLQQRAIANSWGLVWDVAHERLDDDLFRRCYAMVPQSDVAMLLNNWGFKPLYWWLREQRAPVKITNQRHDSLLMSTPPEWAWPIACFLKSSLERPRRYAGNELVIPTEFKLGANAAGSHEFKKFPPRRQFEEVAFGLVR